MHLIQINIQSVSDIITNSSSEVFCTITGKDIEAIADLLRPLFSDNDPELYPFIDFWNEGEWDEGSPAQIQISIPYGYEGVEDFYKAGIEALLDKHFGENNYSIDYEF